MSSRKALVIIAGLSIALRAVLVAGVSPADMDADGAHFLNVARCFDRGQGFSNPAAWPAWMNPVSLPMPETFKEPGFPFVIHLLSRLFEPFTAGLAVSFAAGIMIPLVTFALVRRIIREVGPAFIAGLLAAACPLLLTRSAMVMVESSFTLLIVTSFYLLAMRADARSRARALLLDAAGGVVLGLAFMFRGQTLVALPAVVALGMRRRKPGEWAIGLGITLVAAAATASPFIARNLALFGTPFHSDVGAYALWPYVDHLTFSHGLERPPAPIPFALAHLPEVFRHSVSSAVRFATSTLPNWLLGNPLWVPGLVVGLIIAAPRWRDWAFAYLYAGATLGLVFPVHWDERYFASSTPMWLIFAGLGSWWIWRELAQRPLLGRLRAAHLLVLALAVTFLAQFEFARRLFERPSRTDNVAARAAAPWIRERTSPDEAALVLTTSFFSWFSDRPTVHLVIASQDRFDEIMRRHHVRVAVLPTDRLDEYAARYPEGRLPTSLGRVADDAETGMTFFEVNPSP